jgi:nicotinate-nucleotide adenylyltransferase
MTSHSSGIGILGGTFDPVHLGHTQSAQLVANELNLEKVLLIPVHISPHKTSSDLSPHANTEQRAKMVALACQQFPLFSCDMREINRQGNSYTIDTLNELKQEFPSQTLYFIIGMDSLLNFTRWHKYLEILSVCHLVVNTRPHYSMEQFNPTTQKLLDEYQTTDLLELKNQSHGKIFFAQESIYDISSTHIRQCLSQAENCQQQLHPAVADFIHKNNLYR